MPLPTPTDDDVNFVREVAGEASKEFISTLVDKLDNAEWARAQDFITAWNGYAPGSVMELVNGGHEGVNEKDQEALEDIRRRMRLLLGLSEFREGDGGFVRSTSVPVLWVF